MIVQHDEQPAQRGYYSKILNRAILGVDQGLATCTIVDQIIPAGGYIVPSFRSTINSTTMLRRSCNGIAGYSPCHGGLGRD